MNFDLGVILSLSTGKALINSLEIQKAYDYIYSQYRNVVFDMEQMSELTSEYVLSLYPQLRGIGATEEFKSWEEVGEFVNAQKQQFGDALLVTPLTETAAMELTSRRNGKSR